MVQIKLLETSYKYHHKDPEKIEQFYQYIYDLCDYKSLELVLDHIWPLEKRLHENNELEAVKFIRKHFKGLFHLQSVYLQKRPELHPRQKRYTHLPPYDMK